MTSSDVDHWQCERSLPQCMEYMLDNKLLCDVTFLVGEGHDKVHAHKLMLASRSPVFYAMLEGQLAEKGIIEIPDIDKETFLMLLRYMYTDSISLEAKNVLNVMYAAKKYCVDLLTKSCAEFLKDKITPENACTILDAALRFSEEEIIQKCLEVIKRGTIECIRSESFAALSKEALLSILKLDNMTVKEEQLYEQVMRWCEMECARRELEVSWENKRLALGDALYEIRFPLMNPEYFASEIGRTNLLSSDEKVEVLIYYTLKKKAPTTAFKDSRRKTKIRHAKRVIRFKNHSKSWGLSGDVDAITFLTSHDSLLHGIAVYGCKRGSCDYTIDVTVKDSSGLKLLTQSTSLRSESNVQMIDLMFESELTIQANHHYTIGMTMVGPSSLGGSQGETSVAYGNGKRVTFSNSSSSTNLTDVTEGQIPALLLVDD